MAANHEISTEYERFDDDGTIYRRYAGPGYQADVMEISDDTAYIQRIDVDESERGRGLGTAVIKTIAGQFWKTYAAPDNKDSQRLFERLGERVEGVVVDGTELDYLDQGYGVYEVYRY